MAALRPTAIRALQAQRGAFRASAPIKAVKPTFQPHFYRITPENVTKYVWSDIVRLAFSFEGS